MENKVYTTNATYKVKKANQEQVDFIIENLYKHPNAKNYSIVFAAVDDDENIIGYLIAEEKTVPPPINGTDWFIWNIFLRPEYRRQGIGTAILNEVIKQARQKNIKHLIGSCTNTPAHLFWLKHGFCFRRYGQIMENGNVPHLIFYRLDKPKNAPVKTADNFCIVKAEQSRLDKFLNERIPEKYRLFVNENRDRIFGFTAVDNDKNIIGFITVCPYEIGEPIDGTQWLTPYIFVNEEHRRNGIGSVLLNEILVKAKEENIIQLGSFWLDENAINFVYRNNFSLCTGYIFSGDVKPISAAIRI